MRAIRLFIEKRAGAIDMISDRIEVKIAFDLVKTKNQSSLMVTN